MAVSKKKPPDLVARLLASLPGAGALPVEAALSGGLDSVVLLHALCAARARLPFDLSAVHVHHGLSPHAEDWVRHCASLCRDLGVPLRIVRVTLAPRGGESLEALARAARYAAFDPGRVTALAHHEDDQVETVMLQWLRGGGPRAMAAMPPVRSAAAHGVLWRPLLDVSRATLRDYAASQGLAWVEDESNADPRWLRNRIRHGFWPQIEAALPDARQGVLRSAALMADAAAVLDEVAASDLAACSEAGCVRLDRFAGLSAPRQRQVLLRWIASLSAGFVAPEALEAFRHQLLTAGRDRHPQLRLDRGVLLRYRERVWHVPDLPAPDPADLAWQGGAAQVLPAGTLVWTRRAGGLDEAVLARGLRIVPRQGGERLAQAVGRKTVKHLLQEAGMPPLLRTGWPLLADPDGVLLAVPSVALSVDHVAGTGWWPEWHPRENGSADS